MFAWIAQDIGGAGGIKGLNMIMLHDDDDDCAENDINDEEAGNNENSVLVVIITMKVAERMADVVLGLALGTIDT